MLRTPPACACCNPVWARLRGAARGTRRFDPYDLATLAIYDDAGVLIETTSASRQSTTQVPNVPAESAAKPAQVSTAARTYLDYGAMGDAGDRTKVAIPMPHALLVRKAHLNGYRLRMSDRIERRLSEAEHGTL